MIRCARIDPQGGIAGDMFIAAIIDAMPELSGLVDEVMTVLPVPSGTEVSLLSHHDGAFGGRRLNIKLPDTASHTRWIEIRNMICKLDLDPPSRDLAIEIFRELAAVEARIHHREIDDVVFHEIGAWDSVIDIVLSASLIIRSGVTEWAVSTIPLGSGLVQSQHGVIAVPAPATRQLLAGFDCIDDGIGGERVTPTGAAILKTIVGKNKAQGRMVSTGAGFGQRTLSGTSNCVWISIFESGSSDFASEKLDQIAFEVDDATPEELAIGLERLRAVDGVLDVFEMTALGKKGRHAHAVRLLCEPTSTQHVARACFLQTPTLGLRIVAVERLVLPRSLHQSDDGIGVKIAERPGGQITAKAEIDHVSGETDHRDRVQKAYRAANSCL